LSVPHLTLPTHGPVNRHRAAIKQVPDSVETTLLRPLVSTTWAHGEQKGLSKAQGVGAQDISSSVAPVPSELPHAAAAWNHLQPEPFTTSYFQLCCDAWSLCALQAQASPGPSINRCARQALRTKVQGDRTGGCRCGAPLRV